MSDTVQVNFGIPMPLFPLDAMALMPHGIAPLHVFEPRYRQLVSDALDGEKQFAMAMYEERHGGSAKMNAHGHPALRPVVCVGHIVRHEKTPDGRYGVLLQGLCRARMLQELPPEDGVMYRRAFLMPLEIDDVDEGRLEGFRRRLTGAIESDKLGDLRDSARFLEHLKNPEIPTSVILEVLGFTYLADAELRYQLLASDDAVERAAILSRELMAIQRLIARAAPQRGVEAPKGVCWN